MAETTDLSQLLQKDIFLLFEFAALGTESPQTYLFTDPLQILEIKSLQDVSAVLAQIDILKKDHFVAGYLNYELGYLLEPELFPDFSSNECLAKFFVFHKPTLTFLENSKSANNFTVSNIQFDHTLEAFTEKISLIKKELQQGNTYQVNFTGRLTFDFSGEAWGFYQNLKQKQKTAYSAFLKIGSEYLLSLSPELFFELRGAKLTVRPMKGTAARGKTLAEDEEQKKILLNEKNRAENLMIVDLMRNDLGRICVPGSVETTGLFTPEKYASLFQLTSTITGTLRPEVNTLELLQTLFPGGSVTGAPKLRTMQLIQTLESSPREVYCGGIGFFSPDQTIFNLPIRTLQLKSRQGTMGIGSGITYASLAAEEYQECLLKAQFLTEPTLAFELIETMLWDKKYILLLEHLARLSFSAHYFDIPFSPEALFTELESLASKFSLEKKQRIRILVSQAGKILIENTELLPLNSSRIIISNIQIDPNNKFLYHKTTQREIYDQEFKKYSEQGYADVLFFNTAGELTEGAITNVFVRLNGQLYTPPLASGLLPGLLRQQLLGAGAVQEKVTSRQELLGAQEIFIGNSVRGLIPVTIKN